MQGVLPRLPERIDNLIKPSRNIRFQFIDAVAAGKSSGTGANGSPAGAEQSIFGILSLIARQLKIMLLCKAYDEMGYNLSQIQAKLKAEPYKLHPYSVQKECSSHEALPWNSCGEA